MSVHVARRTADTEERVQHGQVNHMRQVRNRLKERLLRVALKIPHSATNKPSSRGDKGFSGPSLAKRAVEVHAPERRITRWQLID